MRDGDKHDRISLHGHDPEDVLKALLKVDPEAEPVTETVYVALKGEAVDAWRPVSAAVEGDGIYRLPLVAPSNEQWEFPPGSLVRAELRMLDDGDHMVAIAVAD